MHNSTFKAQTFSGMRALESLDIFSLNAAILPSRLISDLQSLKILRVAIEGGADQITVVEEDLLAGAPNLQYVDLSLKRIQSLPADLLNHAPSLEAVNLSFDLAGGQIPERFLNDLQNLSYFDLNSTSHLTLPKRLFEHSGNLEGLTIRADTLGGLENEIFSQTRLRYLQLYAHRIETIPPSLTRGLSHLTTLTIRTIKNEEETLPRDFLEGLDHLETLQLEMSLRSLPNDFLMNKSRLAFINMSYNEFSDLSPDLFSHLPSLGIVHLGGNPLTDHSKQRLKQSLGDKVEFSDSFGVHQ